MNAQLLYNIRLRREAQTRDRHQQIGLWISTGICGLAALAAIVIWALVAIALVAK